MVERYDFEASWSCSECGTEHETPDLVLNPDGNYVSYKDYEYLEAEKQAQAEPPAGGFREPILTWDKPMTSQQAAKYLLTNGFVAVELYRVRQQEIEKLNGTKKDLEEDLFSSKIALASFARWNKTQAEELEKLKRLVKECVAHLLAGGYFTPEELEQVLKGN